MANINLTCTRNFHLYQNLLKQATNLKGKKHSSQMWLQRQLTDHYVELAQRENYRCRSAFKLLEINNKYNVLTPGKIVIECGAAPGSWTQVATKCVNSNRKTIDKPIGRVIAIDRILIHPVDGAEILSKLDFTTKEAQMKLCELLKDDKIDVLLSDMAPNASGVAEIDHEAIISLVYSALKFSMRLMKTDGIFLAKVWDGNKSSQMEKDLLTFYKNVRIIRPMATRSESSEMFFLARGFKGIKT